MPLCWCQSLANLRINNCFEWNPTSWATSLGEEEELLKLGSSIFPYLWLSYFTLLFLPIVKRLHIDVGLVHKILAQNGPNV
jgi:hypothetical protein